MKRIRKRIKANPEYSTAEKEIEAILNSPEHKKAFDKAFKHYLVTGEFCSTICKNPELLPKYNPLSKHR